jgi:hypothetical protein
VDSCALALPEGWEDDLCQKCRNRANREAETYRQQQEVAARYEAAQPEFASAGPAPF